MTTSPMLVVSNTSPILNLAIVGQLALLRDQFGEIRVPVAVYEELIVDEDLPGCRAVREALDAGWIRVMEVEDQALARVLQRELDRGEAEAIALAVQVAADCILLESKTVAAWRSL